MPSLRSAAARRASDPCHFGVKCGGAIAWAMARLLAAGASLPPPQRQRSTSPRATLIRSSSSFSWNCGWVSIEGRVRPVSGSGSCGPERAPFLLGHVEVERGKDDESPGSRATVPSNRATAGAAVVIPAAQTKPEGGAVRQRRAS